MKRILIPLLLISMMLISSCGESEESSEEQTETSTYEVAMIADKGSIDDGGFVQETWSCVQQFASEHNLTSNYYESEKDDTDAYLAAVKEATEGGAKLVIFPGSGFEVAAYKAQSEYADIDFLLIDGVPHSSKGKYATKSNTISVSFAEEESGFLAGYAAVKDGYKKIAFMGGKKQPTVKRYGYGFIQGAAMAAEELKVKVELRYIYAGTFKASKKVKKTATSWYKDGTQVIFACGGAIGKSVMEAAEKSGGKVIGVDIDQSSISETVITSAEKNISEAVENVLRDFANENFVGEMAFNYTAKNDGVKLEMENARFKTFTNEDYKEIFAKLQNEKIELKKDTQVKSLKSIAGDNVKIIKK